MRFDRINPFIRHAAERKYSQMPNIVYKKTYDCRLWYILDGTGEFFFKQTGERIHLKKGDLLIHGADLEYALFWPRQEAFCFYVICFDYTQNNSNRINHIFPDITEDFDAERICEQVCFSDYPFFNEPLFLHDMQLMELDLKEIVFEFDKQSVLFREKSSAILKKAICNVARKINLQNERFDKKTEIVLDFIFRHYRENLSNADICSRLHYHPYYINKMIKAQTGKTIHQHLTEHRLHEATKLLVTTDMSISLIAEETGFSSQAHFASSFKMKTGKTPSKYRQKYKNQF